MWKREAQEESEEGMWQHNAGLEGCELRSQNTSTGFEEGHEPWNVVTSESWKSQGNDLSPRTIRKRTQYSTNTLIVTK